LSYLTPAISTIVPVSIQAGGGGKKRKRKRKKRNVNQEQQSKAKKRAELHCKDDNTGAFFPLRPSSFFLINIGVDML